MKSTLKTIWCAIGAMLAASCFISAHGAVSVTASRTYVVQETTLHASETSGQNVLIYTLGSQSNKFVVAKDGLEMATRMTPVTEPGTTNVIGYYIGTNVNAKVASSDVFSKVAGLSPVYGQGEYSRTVIGYTLGYDTQKVAASEDWLSKVTEVKPIISSDDSPQRVVGYTMGTNAYVFASDKSVEVQQAKKVVGSATNVVGYTIGGNTNNVFVSIDGVKTVIPNYDAVSNAAMRSMSRISDGTNVLYAGRNVYRIDHNSWFMYKYMDYVPEVPYELYYHGDVAYSNMSRNTTGLIKDFYVSKRRIASKAKINGVVVVGDVFIGVDGSTTNVVTMHERRSDGVYPIIWSYPSSVSNGVIYAFDNGNTECDIRRLTDEEVSTNFVGRLALTNDVVTLLNPGLITDGTNTIDAAGNVYTTSYEWQFTGQMDDDVISLDYSENAWTMVVYSDSRGTDSCRIAANEDATRLVFDFPDGGRDYSITATMNKQIYLGKLALTNDFSTSNAALVATIESVAPTPGNYATVSNRAMTASSYTDAALGAFAETGSVARAEAYGTSTRWTDSTGCVWEVANYWTLHNGDDEVRLTYGTKEDSIWAFGYPEETVSGRTGTMHYHLEIHDGVAELSVGEYYGDYIDDYYIYPNGNSIDVTVGYDGGNYVDFSGQIDNTYAVWGMTNLIGRVALTNDLPDVSGYATQLQSTNAAVAVVDEKISTNNAAFVSAVLAVPLTGADAGDIAEIAEYGSYGTVGAAILALIAGLAALRRRVGTAETAIAQKASSDDLPYALVTPGEWSFSELPTGYSDPVCEWDSSEGAMLLTMQYDGSDFEIGNYDVTQDSLSVSFQWDEGPGTETHVVTATRASLPGHLCDRAVNAVPVAGATTLTLPSLVTGKSRDLLVRLTVSADAAITFSAPSGETVTWDDAGSPTATYEAGTHLLRFTEVNQTDVNQSIFHFTDLGDGGSIDPAVLNGKLEATSAAKAFDPTKTYSVGEYVTYEGVLYECIAAVATAGAWTGLTNWKVTDMTTPDATLDLMADGRLRLVSADGDVLWMQGYGLASASSVTLSCDKVNFHAFAAVSAFDATASYSAGDVVAYDGVVYVFTAAHSAGAWTGSDASVYAVALEMPTAPIGKVGDFVLDVDNTATASASVTATLTGAGTAFDVFTPEGVNLSTDILTFAGGEQCELYFTMTAFGTAAKPAWKVVKQVVEKQEFGS